MRMPKTSDRIEVWTDIVQWISLFFNEASSFSANVDKAICADLSFCWTAKNMDVLLHSIEVDVDVAILACNHYEESFNLINWEWGMDAEEYIW